MLLAVKKIRKLFAKQYSGKRISNFNIKRSMFCLNGYRYSGDLKSDLVWISNGPKQVGLQMVWISNGIWNPEAQPFEIRTNGRHFVKNHLKSGQKRPDFEWLIAKARPFENRTIWNPTFKKSGFQMFPDFKWSDFRSPLYLLPNTL